MSMQRAFIPSYRVAPGYINWESSLIADANSFISKTIMPYFQGDVACLL